MRGARNSNVYQRKAIGFLMFAFCFSCSFSTKENANDGDIVNANLAGWTVTISGKVGFPEKGGQIIIQEIKNNASGWQDTITLKSDYSFSKKVPISQPGYYKINFFNAKRNWIVIIAKLKHYRTKKSSALLKTKRNIVFTKKVYYNSIVSE